MKKKQVKLCRKMYTWYDVHSGLCFNASVSEILGIFLILRANEGVEIGVNKFNYAFGLPTMDIWENLVIDLQKLASDDNALYIETVTGEFYDFILDFTRFIKEV